ncbi:MAG: hypothetical protein ACETVV_02990 [Nitrososphaeria archaeon]
MERVVLTTLVWGLILETLALVYFFTSGETWKFEFQYMLLLFAITLAVAAFFLLRLLRRVRGARRFRDQLR